jgi:hypothetical protein
VKGGPSAGLLGCRLATKRSWDSHTIESTWTAHHSDNIDEQQASLAVIAVESIDMCCCEA